MRHLKTFLLRRTGLERAGKKGRRKLGAINFLYPTLSFPQAFSPLPSSPLRFPAHVRPRPFVRSFLYRHSISADHAALFLQGPF